MVGAVNAMWERLIVFIQIEKMGMDVRNEAIFQQSDDLWYMVG